MPSAGLIAPIVGHVGDGNFHVLVLMDVDDPDEIGARRGLRAAAQHAGASPWTAPAPASTASGRASGNISGRTRPEALDAMRALKQALDPQNILNPGKIVPAG